MAEARGPPGQFATQCTRVGWVMADSPPGPPYQVPHDGPWIEDWLGVPRLDRYLTTAGGDRLLALSLYEWNAQISSALQRDLAHLEVALRNAYDRAAGAWVGQGHWLRDGYPQVFAPLYRQRNGRRVDMNQRSREQVRDAIREAGGSTASPDDVIAQLTFGFWRYLSTSAHDQSLWVPFLHRAFLPGTTRRQIDRRLERLHLLRNRIAHHEHLIGTDLGSRCTDIVAIAAALSPDLEQFLRSSTTTTHLLATRPRRSP